MKEQIDYKNLRTALLYDMEQGIIPSVDIDDMLETIERGDKEISEGKGIPADIAIAKLKQIFIKKETQEYYLISRFNNETVELLYQI